MPAGFRCLLEGAGDGLTVRRIIIGDDFKPAQTVTTKLAGLRKRQIDSRSAVSLDVHMVANINKFLLRLAANLVDFVDLQS